MNKYHVYSGCKRNVSEARLTRSEFVNTLSSQRCRKCERIAFGEVAARAAAVSRGEMIEAREGETMRLTRNGAEVIRNEPPEPITRWRVVSYFGHHQTSGLVIEEFDDPDNCRRSLALYREKWPRVEFRNRVHLEHPNNDPPTYAKFFPDFDPQSDLARRMAAVNCLEETARRERRRIRFELEMRWPGKAITAAKIAAAEEWKNRTGGENYRNAAVMRAY